LAAMRELAMAGWAVGLGSDSRYGWSSASRWISRWHYIPPPVGNPMKFIREVNQLAEKYGYELVFGAGDAEVLALSANRDNLIPQLPYTTHPSVLSVFDKLRLADLTRAAGLRSPAIYPLHEDLPSEVAFPAIVKSRLHWSPDIRNEKTRVETTVVSNRDEAMWQADKMQSVGAEPLMQEMISGHIDTFVAITDRTGKILSKHMQRTTHEYGSESGISARAISIPSSDDFVQKVQCLLANINWFGLASIQFIQPDDGDPALIDFNGRMYGSLAFANACGMRAMENWVRMATGVELVPSTETLGLKYQALEGDLRRVKKLRGIRRGLEIGSCLFEAARSVHPILSWSDPVPTLHYLRRLGLRLFGKGIPSYER